MNLACSFCRYCILHVCTVHQAYPLRKIVLVYILFRGSCYDCTAHAYPLSKNCPSFRESILRSLPISGSAQPLPLNVAEIKEEIVEVRSCDVCITWQTCSWGGFYSFFHDAWLLKISIELFKPQSAMVVTAVLTL